MSGDGSGRSSLPGCARVDSMPWWASLYIAFILMSLPFGLVTIHRLEQDLLHPVGGLLSSLLSVSFVMSYFLPELLPYQGVQTWLLLGFVLGWDGYSFLRLKDRLSEVIEQADESVDMQGASFFVGLVLILPAYIWGFLVCMRAVA